MNEIREVDKVNFGDMGKLMKQVQKAQEELERVQEEVKERTVEASAGGGAITVTCSGGLDITRIKIDPSVIDPDDVEMLEDLVVAAANAALRKAQDMVASEISKLTGGLNMPGLPGLPT